MYMKFINLSQFPEKANQNIQGTFFSFTGICQNVQD